MTQANEGSPSLLTRLKSMGLVSQIIIAIILASIFATIAPEIAQSFSVLGQLFVNGLKAVNSIPPSYRIFLLNGQFFDIIYEDYSLMAKIEKKEYYLADLDERNYAKKHINRLMTEPIVKTADDEAEAGDIDAGLPPTPTPTPTPEPEEPEV